MRPAIFIRKGTNKVQNIKTTTRKIWAIILSTLTILSSMTLMLPTLTEAATSSQIVSYWPSGGYSHHRFIVNGKDAFCINYSTASSGTFKTSSKAKAYYNNLGSGKQNKINQILTYAAKRGYLNYSGSGTITVNGSTLKKKDVYYSAVQRAIWQVTDKTASNKGLSSWYKNVTKSAYNDIMNNYSKMLTADDVPSFNSTTLEESKSWSATVKDVNKVLNTTDWKITSYSGLKSASISGNSVKVAAKEYFSGTKYVKMSSKYTVYDLNSSYAGIFGSQYAIMTAGGNKTLNSSMSVKSKKNIDRTPNPHKAYVQVKKTDQNGNGLSGVKFKLSYIDQDGLPRNVLALTDDDGIAKFGYGKNNDDSLDVYKNDEENNNKPTTKIQYTLEEVSGPDDYFSLPGTTKQTFTLTTGQTYNATTKGYNSWVNIQKLGDLKVIKYAENANGSYDFGKSFEFTLTNNETKKSYTSITNDNGEAYFCNVPVGEYTLSETNKDAYIPIEDQIVEIEWDGNTSLSNREFSTDASQYTESTTIRYTDSDMPEFNGDGELPDVVPDYDDPDLGDQSDVEDTTFNYDITNGVLKLTLTDDNGNAIQDSEFTLCASDNSELATFVTDTNGNATVVGLYGGKYYVKQITTRSDCYLSTDTYDFEISENNQLVELTVQNEVSDDTEDVDPDTPAGVPTNVYTIYNNIKRGDLQIVKTEEVIGQNPLEDGTIQNGVGFKFTVTSSASDNALSVDLKYTVTTGADGNAALYDIPIGTYTVSEIQTPTQYVKPSDVIITVSWDKQTSYTVAGAEKFNVSDNSAQQATLVTVNMINRLDRVKIMGHKVDENGNIVKGAVFGIFNKNATEYTVNTAIATSTTDNNGDFSFANVPHGTYQIVELSCPKGYYFKQEPKVVKVDGSQKVINFTFVNELVKGRISITKIGEGLISIEKTKNGYTPIYGDVGLSDVVFNIYAAEDIKTPDGTLVYSQGDLVEQITTGENGFAITSELPLGKYNIVEQETHPGYKLNIEPVEVSLEYKDSNTRIVTNVVTIKNQRQKLQINLKKFMEIDETFGIGNNNEIKDVSFGVYAKEDIVAPDGSKIPAGSLIAICYANSEGVVEFNVDLPFGYDYYVKEITTNNQYVLDKNIYDVSFKEVSSELENKVVDINEDYFSGDVLVNKIIKGTITITKTDVSTGKVIPNCKVEILDKDGNVVAKGITDKNGQVSFTLPYGDYYYREYEAPEGYILDTTPHKFSIMNDGEIIKATMANEPETPETPETPEVPEVPTGISYTDILAPAGLTALVAGIWMLITNKKKRENK